MTGPRSLEDLPWEMTRLARAALAFCVLRCRTDTGEVERKDGLTPAQRVAQWCGVNRTAAFRALLELETHGFVMREGKTSRARLYVLIHDLALFRTQAPSVENACECGEPKSAIRGAKTCPKCLQAYRRAWKGDALEMWRTGKAKKWGDMKIAHHISLRLNRPLWGRAEEGVQGSGSGDGEGVIPALVTLGVFPEEMMTLARRARSGDEGED
jgi:ribosomal protein L32